MELVTSRLLLRELTETDRDAVHRYAGDPAVTRFMDWGPNRLADTIAFLAEAGGAANALPRVSYSLAVVVRASDELVGAVHLGEVSSAHRRGEMGYVLAAAQWGKGYATEAAAAMLHFDSTGCDSTRSPRPAIRTTSPRPMSWRRSACVARAACATIC